MADKPTSPVNDRTLYDQRFAALDNDFSSWKPVYQDLSKFILPFHGRYLESDVNDGRRRDEAILDSTGTRAARTLSAGLMAGMTSPARPWFRLITSDPDLMEHQAVKEWVHAVAELMRRIFATSNTYRSLHSMYDELGTFSTGLSIMLPDYDHVIRHYTQTAGEYRLAQSNRGVVDTVYREFPQTVSQLVEWFGIDNVSVTVKSLYNTGKLDANVIIRHAIEPRADRDHTKRDNQNMPWKSVYYEKGGDNGKLLSESGFLEFPGLTPRWLLAGSDVYGRGPGMEALGDVKELQFLREIRAKATAYQGDPPVQIPASLKGAGQHDLLPGGESYYDDINGATGGIRTAFDVPLDTNTVREDIFDLRQQINSAYYADLFTMLQQLDRRQMTATEVAERHEEKLLVLGPVLERLHNEMLDPLIERTFAMALRAGIIPEPPLEMQNQEIKVEYVSMLAQAQRAVGVTAVDRLIGTVASLSAVKPDAIDKIDGDQIVDAYAEMLGISPELIVADEKVALIRQDRNERAAQQQQMETMPQAAAAAKTLSETDVEGDNALTNMFSGL